MRRMLGAARRARPCSTSAAARARWRSTRRARRRARGRASTWRPSSCPRAAREVDLVLGDLRRLPFRKGASRAPTPSTCSSTSTRPGVREVLREARRTLGPRGPAVRLHPRHGVVAAGRGSSAAVNRLARRLGERGLIDHEREAMRKSDHRNAIRSHEHFDALCAAAGLRGRASAATTTWCSRRWWRTCCCGSTSSARRRRRGDGRGGAAASTRTSTRTRPRVGAPPPGPRSRSPWRAALTWLLKLDVVLFGGIRTGPFFGLLRPPPRRAGVRILYVASDQVVPGRTGGSVHVLEVARGLAAPRPRGARGGAPRHGGAPDARGATGVRWHRIAWRPPPPLLPLPGAARGGGDRGRRCGRRW